MALTFYDRTVYIGIYDPPIRLGDGETLTGCRVRVQCPSYGRVLFTETLAVEVVGTNVLIAGNLLEMMGQ